MNARAKARAAVVRECGRSPQLEDVSLDEPGPGEVIVAIAGVGICHTDLAAIDGTPALPLPVVLGHEGSGVVERVGPGIDAVKPGDAVVLSFDSCGTCDRCTDGRPAYCRSFLALNSSGLRRDGSAGMSDARGAPVHGSFCGQSSFATRARASARNAIRVGDAAGSLELLGPLGCSMQTGAGAVLSVLRPDPGSSIAVFGAGAVGLAAVMAARIAGCSTIVAADPHAERRDLALELGATHAIDPTGGDAARRAKDIVRGGVDFAVEAVGDPAVVSAAVRSLASPGICATLGFRGSPNPVTVDQGHLIHGRSLVGVIEGDVEPAEFIPRLVELHREDRFPFDRLVRRYAFDDDDELEAAIDAARHGDVVKPVLVA